MSEHGSMGMSDIESDPEDVERTPRDQQMQGPPTASDLLPRGHPCPTPITGMGVAKPSPDDPAVLSSSPPRPASAKKPVLCIHFVIDCFERDAPKC